LEDSPVDNRELSRMLETAVVAARLAGQRAMEDIDFVTSTVKNETELVTGSDLRAQEIIISTIKNTYPDDGFLAEEGEGGAVFSQQPRGASNRWWVIDPIDGTSNFAHKILLFTVSIAAVVDGRPVVAAVFEPATDSMFTAVTESDTQLNGRRITAGSEGLSQFSSVAIDSYFNEGVPDWICRLIETTRARNFGSTALHMSYLAKGGLTAMVASRPKLWDIAAGSLIAGRAGAIVTDWTGKKIFPVRVENYKGGEINTLAANAKVHGELVKMINQG
jgi:myo-inositol-1(or 4)-monophosphatase